MAITKLLRIKEAKGRKSSAHLQNSICYICNPEKTQDGLWIGGNAGFTAEMIYRTMMENKEFWQKKDYTQGFHYVLSFPPDCKVDEPLAFQIAEEFCHELLGEDYYFVFAVHNDQKHMHAHIIFDSVSKTTGYKFHSPKGDWAKRIQPITDRLCEKYRLPTLEYEEERKGISYDEWKRQKGKKDFRFENGKEYYTWNDIVRDDIDEAIRCCSTYEEFLQYLQADHYQIRDKKYLSLKPYGRGRAIRSYRLGKGYAKTEIMDRIQNKKLDPVIEEHFKTYGDREKVCEIIYAKIKRSPGWKMNAFQKQFYRRWNNTCLIRKPGKLKSAWKYKKDILEIKKLAAGLNYLIEYEIRSPEELLQRRELLRSETEALRLKQQTVQTRLYRHQPNGAVRKYQSLLQKYEALMAGEGEDKKIKLAGSECAGSIEQLEKKLAELCKEIEENCTLEEAYDQLEQDRTEVQEYRKLKNDGKKELQLVDEILRLHFGYEEPKEERSETNIKQQKIKSDDRTGRSEDVGNTDNKDRTVEGTRGSR